MVLLLVPGALPLYTYTRRRHGTRPVLARATPVRIKKLGAALGPGASSRNIPGPDGRPWS